MKKKLLGLMLALLCLNNGVVAQNIEFSRELFEAKNFLASKELDTSSVKMNVVTLTEGKEIVLFNDTNCFVLVASKEYFDCLDTPILAYGLEGGFREEDLVHEKLFLFYVYASQLKRMKEKGCKKNMDYTEEGAMLPLLGKTAWGNEAPYNKFCPTHSASPNIRTKVSSLGVSMAQIMKYYKYPSIGRGKFSYDAGMQGSIDFEKIKVSWNDVRDKYDETAGDEVNAVARLLTATSVSVGTKFDYNRSLSSTEYLRVALVNHFGFSPRCGLYENPSTKEILDYAYRELKAKRPFIYTLFVSSYGTHSIVCDGYDKDYLHFNVGLGGVANGYYRLLCYEDTPTLLSSILVGIEPDMDMDKTREVVVKQPGSLSLLLSEDEQMNLRKLKVKGKLNNADMIILRRMAGVEKQFGNLMDLDLSDTKFVTDKKSYYLSQSAIGYSARATITTSTRTRNYSFDFHDMDKKKWKKFCRLELNKGDGFFFSKNEDGYYINYHTQKGIVNEEMFKNCLNLRRIVLPKETKSVGERAFENCCLLEEVSYDKQVTKIYSSAFKNAYSYGESVKKIHLTDVYVDERSAENRKGQVFGVVEESPMYPGGMSELMKYLQQNIKYPKECKENGIQGRVIVQFVVNTDGSLGNLNVIKPLNPELDKEAIRVVSEMPKWIPGRQRGKPVRVRFTIPITFKL